MALKFLLIFYGCCGIRTNLKVELMAILRGLELAWSGGHRSVICESDSLCALDMIKDGSLQTHQRVPLIYQIRRFKVFN